MSEEITEVLPLQREGSGMVSAAATESAGALAEQSPSQGALALYSPQPFLLGKKGSSYRGVTFLRHLLLCSCLILLTTLLGRCYLSL